MFQESNVSDRLSLSFSLPLQTMPSRKRKRSAEASPPVNNDPEFLASSSSHQQPPAFQSKSSRSKTPRTEAMVPPDHHLGNTYCN